MTYDVTIFGLYLTLKPIAFTIPIGKSHWDIYWYGIIIALGFLLALVYGMKNAKRYNLDTDRMLDVVLVTVPVAILGARTYYVVFDGVKLNSISDFFGFGNSGFSGLAIYGGVIAAFLTGAIMCKLRKVNILDMFDIASVGFLIGQGIGRWGNFVNQEAFGSLTGSSWWGMQSQRTVAEVGAGLVHPCFLYESIWCIAGFFILNHFSKKRKFSGQIILMYCAWYGFGRGFIELLRTDSLMIGGMKVSSLLSFILCIGAATALSLIAKRSKEAVVSAGYSEMFADEEGYIPQEDNTEEQKRRTLKMTQIIDGKDISAAVKARVAEGVKELNSRGITVGLAVIIVGEDPASKVYVSNKKKACEALGILSEEYALPESTTEEELLKLINELNNKKSINGILCQLPLPRHLDEKLIINSILPEKDVDAFHPHNVGRIMIGDYDFVPCTPAGIMEMLKFSDIEVEGKSCVVIGRSNIVGKPMGMLLLHKNGTVTICHSRTRNLKEICLTADILVAAVGKPRFVTLDMVKEGAVVIDVGIHRTENGLCGDVDFENVKEKASAITPVPGGVGPMTIAMLMQNTLTAAKRQNNIDG